MTIDAGRIRRLVLPPADQEIMPGVQIGAFDRALTPAFWAARAFIEGSSGHLLPAPRCASFREEIAACLLGGYGITAEVGWAAFVRIRDAGLLTLDARVEAVHAALSQPLEVGSRRVRYRFAEQKARQLVGAMHKVDALQSLPEDDRALREALLSLPGIGRKTASWITRSWRRSDQVAVLDVHICRACEVAGVFPTGSEPTRQYLHLEKRFLALARALGVRASVLDSLMWQTMRQLTPLVGGSWLRFREGGM